MGDHQDGLALIHQFSEHFKDGVGRFAIQVARRLVGGQEIGVVGQGTGNGYPLSLPGVPYRLAKSMGSITFWAQVSMGSSWKN